MNAIHLQTRLLDHAARATEFGLNWLVQSTLLLAVGLFFAWLLRRRGSAVQSVILRTTLVAVLVCPLATWTLARGGVSGCSIDLPAAWTLQHQEVPEVPYVSDVPEVSISVDEKSKADHDVTVAADSAITLSGQRPLPLEETYPLVREEPPAVLDDPLAENLASSAEISVATTPGSESSSVANSSTGPPNLVVHRFGLIASFFGLVWLTVASILLARLAGAWRQLGRIRRSAADAEPATVAMCRELATRMQTASPDVKHSPYLPSPCLAGLRRPAVLLPEEPTSMPLRDVLIHELAHLRRRDCHWSLLYRLATAVFFFQPLLWRLARRLDATAEEVCDDHVVQFGGDRGEYARRLVDMAALSTTPAATAGVGIVSLKSMLARRVARIMDASRNLSTRAGTLLLTCVLIGGLLGTTIVGLVGIAPKPSLAKADPTNQGSDTTTNSTTASGKKPAIEGGTAAASEDADEAEDIKAADANQDETVVRGQVVGPDGKPIAGAEVAAIAHKRHSGRGGEFLPTGEVLAEATVDENGRYVMRLENVSSKTHRDANVIAGVDGLAFALAWRKLNLDAARGEALLELLPEEPIRGRFVDSEGQPAPNVRFSIKTLMPRAAHPGNTWDNSLRLFKDWPRTWRITSDEEVGSRSTTFPRNMAFISKSKETTVSRRKEYRSTRARPRSVASVMPRTARWSRTWSPAKRPGSPWPRHNSSRA